ncbi:MULTISPECIES: hypothetical protein [Acinetobacter calcoaceticus/baumannii complex]|uniref:Uncharacterized protein n=1 Tax=Acinetobacter seifertii TaxID=1530123 RepID=A0A7H2PR39_9GAMM|nr:MULTISPECIES: hypothetical protein [Acinetobacter calcoaceticus/baumannii complex]MDV4264885.1 hypothetical protein [Acinetobacter seifertii]QNX05322.1 hypothetical protein IC796_19020 [Acinetobacter seifertii]QNY06357.1 hypothetical protein IC769_17880 [Acinetobacter seifertii]
MKNDSIRLVPKTSQYSDIKKAQHPVGLFRIWVLDMTPVVSHDPDA